MRELGNSHICHASDINNFPCGGYATLTCAGNEFRTATGCCVQGTKGCHPVAQKCPTTAGNPIDVLTGDKVETVRDYATDGADSLFFERRYRSNANFTAARKKTSTGSDPERPQIDTTQTRFGKAWRSNFDVFLVPDWRPAYFNSTSGLWIVPRSDIDARCQQRPSGAALREGSAPNGRCTNRPDGQL